jgi:hypothetical protein
MDNFTGFLKADPDITFKIPPYSSSSRWADFTSPNLQFVEFSNYVNSDTKNLRKLIYSFGGEPNKTVGR